MFKNKLLKELDLYYQKEKELLQNFKNCSFMITGSTGMVGSAFTIFFIYLNEFHSFGINIYATSRKDASFHNRFGEFVNKSYFNKLIMDFSTTINNFPEEKIDYIIHAASNSNPVLYTVDPVGTMLSNFIGMNNILDKFKFNNNTKIMYVSSGEVYGDLLIDNPVNEEKVGSYDILQTRSCYPISKQATETLIASYVSQYNIDVYIARLSHVYGFTMTQNDNRAVSSFIRNGVRKENIILKSKGEQIRSYVYVLDVVISFLTMFIHGKKSNAYNVSDLNSVVSINELASMVSQISKVNLEYNLPSDIEIRGFTKLDYQVLDNKKLIDIGWKPIRNIKEGLIKTFEIIKEEELS